jgi:hemolysin III
MKKERPETPISTPKEELWNSITHGIGIPIALTGLVLLILNAIERESSSYWAAALIYGSTMLWTYTTSTLYHISHRASPKRRYNLHLLDHTAIYLFIAGTYTPIALFALPDLWSALILSAVWTLALGGVLYKIFLIGRYKRLSLAIYLLMGWLIIFAFKPLYDSAPEGLIFWILAGGAAYTLGTIFFSLRKMKYAHSVWHLFVLAGSICHFVGIYLYI